MMNDDIIRRHPTALEAILSDTDVLGFDRASETKVGALLAVLAATKPGGRFLELGTGTGHGAAWLLSGMDAASTLESVDKDAKVVEVAQRHLAADERVTFHVMAGEAYIQRATGAGFDLIYADTWPGKFSHLDEVLALLRHGGIYVVDDLLPQPTWPDGRAPKVSTLIDDLERRSEFVSVRLGWASGLMVVVRKGA